MKRCALIMIGVLVGISYYQYTRVSSLVGPKVSPLGPAAYRAAARTAAMTAMGQRGFASALSQAADNQPVPRVRFQSTLQPKSSLAIQLKKPLSVRMMHSQKRPSFELEITGLGHRSRVSIPRREQWVAPESIKSRFNDPLNMLNDAGGLFKNASRFITDPMLQRIGIPPEEVEIVEFDSRDPKLHFGASAVIFRHIIQDRNLSNEFKDVKYFVFIPVIITDEGEIDPYSVAQAAHEFGHIKNGDGRRIQSFIARRGFLKTMRYLFEKRFMPHSESVKQEEREQAAFYQKIEKEADETAVKELQELDVAYYLSGHMHRCLLDFYKGSGEYEMQLRSKAPIAYSGHPSSAERRDYLGSMAKEQEEARVKEKEQERQYGPIFGPITALEHAKRQYPNVYKSPSLKSWTPWWKEKFGRSPQHFWGVEDKPTEIKP